MRLLSGHQGSIRSLSYAPDGHRLASASEDGTVRVWDLTSEGAPLVLQGHAGGAEAATFLPDGRLVTGAAEGQLVLGDASTGRKVASISAHEGGVRHLACAPGQPLVVSAGWDRGLKTWDLKGVRKRLPAPDVLAWDRGLEIGALAFRDSTTLAVGACFAGATDEEPVIRYLDLTADAVDEGALDDNVRALAFSADGRWCVLSDPGREVRCDEVGTGRSLTFPDHGCILAVAFVPGPYRVLTSGSDGQVRLYVLGDALEEVGAYSWHSDWVTCLAVSPDGMTAASGSEDRTVAVWDLADL
jgi:WD40 repeat protein